MKEKWRLVRRRADQDVSLVGIVFSIFLLQNQEQLLKQEHMPLSSLLPHLAHPLYQELKCFHGNQAVGVYPYTQLTTPLCTFRTRWVLLPWQQGEHMYLMQEVTIGAQVPSRLHIVLCVWERAYELIQDIGIDTLCRMWKSVSFIHVAMVTQIQSLGWRTFLFQNWTIKDAAKLIPKSWKLFWLKQLAKTQAKPFLTKLANQHRTSLFQGYCYIHQHSC